MLDILGETDIDYVLPDTADNPDDGGPVFFPVSTEAVGSLLESLRSHVGAATAGRTRKPGSD